MGGRLSRTKAADGISEVPAKPKSANALSLFTRSKGRVNGRTVMAPLAAFTMACLLFVYSRTAIRAAKLNAQKHREADGGQISWRKESLRQHGMLDKVENNKETFKEALLSNVKVKKQNDTGVGQGKTERAPEEDQLRKMLGKDSPSSSSSTNSSENTRR